MEPRTCLAALALLALTFLPAALSKRSDPAATGCDDRLLLERIDPLALRGALPVVGCGGGRAPRGAAALLLGHPIDLSDATAAELEALPGIGPGRARRIAAHAPYRSLADLRRVPGLGTKRIAALAGWARAGPGVEDAPPAR